MAAPTPVPAAGASAVTKGLRGRLFLVPAPLDFGCGQQVPLEQVVPMGTVQAAARLTHWVCENAKSARAYLKRIGDVTPLAAPIRDQQILELPRPVHKKGDHRPGSFDARPLLAAAVEGHDIGLVSEAGMPAVADPGSSVVAAAHELGLAVIPLVGPVSPLLALAASGLNGQQFAFWGYLPQDTDALIERIRVLESQALRTGQTQIFIETPYRNAALWEKLVRTLQPQTRLAFARALTLPDAECRCSRVSVWRQHPSGPANDGPAIFAFGP
jgi:16S rRNA (cytidine1402-2'-O)-methyltransferase